MNITSSFFNFGFISGLNYSRDTDIAVLPKIFQFTKNFDSFVFKQGDFDTFNFSKIKDIKKFEFFNDYTGKFESVTGEDLRRLLNIGLNRDKLEKIISVYSKWNNINLNMYSFTDFIDILMVRSERSYINNNSKEIFEDKFWELVSLLDDESIYKFAEENQCLIKNEHNQSVLILESFSKNDEAFDRKGVENLATVSMLSKVYNVCSRTFSSVNQFCEIIKDHTKKSLTKLLLIKAHGSKRGIAIHSDLSNEKIKLGFGSNQISDCFKNIKEESTIVVDACQSGYNGPLFPNFANFLANNVPIGTNIVSSIFEHTTIFIDPNNPLLDSIIYSTKAIKEIFTKSTGYFFKNGYGNEKLCPIDKVSYLDFCTKFPIFKFKENSDGQLILGFDSKYFKIQFNFLNQNLVGFIDNLGFNNQDLEQISLNPILRIKDQSDKLGLYIRSIYENKLYKLPQEFEPYFMVKEFNIKKFINFIKENKKLIKYKEDNSGELILYFKSIYDDTLYILPSDISSLIKEFYHY